MDDRIKTLRDSLKKLNSKWTELFNIFEKASTESKTIDLSNKYSAKLSIVEINRVILSLTEWFNALLPSDEGRATSLLLNQTHLEDTSQCLNSISEKISGIIAQLKHLEKNPSSLESVSAGPKFIISSVGEIDITTQLTEINNYITVAINLIGHLSPLLKDQPSREWEDYLESLQQSKNQAKLLRMI